MQLNICIVIEAVDRLNIGLREDEWNTETTFGPIMAPPCIQID